MYPRSSRYAVVRHRLAFPGRRSSPLARLLVRLAIAVAILILAAVLVFAERGGYSDSSGSPLSFLDALYYATVSLTTTGYGDIVPVTPTARLITILLITPLRLAFLAILLTTTVLALTEQFRRQQREHSWRKRMRDHTIVCGYGVQGRAAVRSLRQTDPKIDLVVLEQRGELAKRATADGLTALPGDARESRILESVNIHTARRVVIAVGRDDTAALITLTVRRLNPKALIVVSVNELENAPLLRQSGATVVVSAQDSAGALLGISALSPSIGTVAEDLLDFSDGLDLAERPVAPHEVGRSPRQLDDVVLAVVRAGQLHRLGDDAAAQLAAGDQIVCIRRRDKPRPAATHAPAAPDQR